jgi:pheromone shutdown-related protein TraB
VLADRDIQITFKRIWGNLGFWNKSKLLAHMVTAVFETKQLDKATVEQLKNQDEMETIMAEFSEKFPQIKHRLIDERDVYLAQKIRSAEGQKIVAVVGAGHVEGISRQIREDHALDDLEQLPPKSIVPTLLAWGLPLLLVALMVYGFVKGDPRAASNVWIWVLATGGLSAIGAAVAMGHPLAVLSAFVAAPFTALHPLIAAGWVSGLVQAWVRRPTVDDFEDLPNSISSLRGFWTNPVSKVLLVTALTNLGGTLGFALAVGWIGARAL